ncbi:hypothetical protein FRC14_001193, partial [Serendipita sp. 396]
APAPRVVNVSSNGHRWTAGTGIEWDTLKGPKKGSFVSLFDSIASVKLYGQSKLGNILHTNELARRYGEQGLVAISVHPGLIASDLSRDLGFISRNFMNIAGYSPETGALTQVYAANSPDAHKLSGKYLVPIARVGNPYSIAKNQELAKQLWEWCHRGAPWNGFYWNTLKGPKKDTWIPFLKDFQRFQCYAQSKLGNILHANELARRYGDKGLIAISVHPGVIDSELKRELDFVAQWIYGMIGYPATLGAVTQLYAANAPEAEVYSGKVRRFVTLIRRNLMASL